MVNVIKTLHNDLKIPFIKDEITEFSKKYIETFESHPNYLALNLLDK